MDFSHIGHIMQATLKRAICSTIEAGCRCFYGGMAKGFDIIAAELVIKEKNAGADIALVSVVPFRGQERGWGSHWSERHDEVLQASDKIIVLNDRYISGCYHERNRFLIDNSDMLICLFNGKSGGTKYTFNYAEKKSIQIVNIWDNINKSDFLLF